MSDPCGVPVQVSAAKKLNSSLKLQEEQRVRALQHMHDEEVSDLYV